MEYNKIVNPQTGRKCLVRSPIGRKVLKNYISRQSGGNTNCQFNEKTSRCSVRKDGQPNDPKCEYNSDSKRCKKVSAPKAVVNKATAPKAVDKKTRVPKDVGHKWVLEGNNMIELWKNMYALNDYIFATYVHKPALSLKELGYLREVYGYTPENKLNNEWITAGKVNEIVRIFPTMDRKNFWQVDYYTIDMGWMELLWDQVVRDIVKEGYKNVNQARKILIKEALYSLETFYDRHDLKHQFLETLHKYRNDNLWTLLQDRYDHNTHKSYLGRYNYAPLKAVMINADYEKRPRLSSRPEKIGYSIKYRNILPFTCSYTSKFEELDAWEDFHRGNLSNEDKNTYIRNRLKESTDFLKCLNL